MLNKKLFLLQQNIKNVFKHKYKIIKFSSFIQKLFQSHMSLSQEDITFIIRYLFISTALFCAVITAIIIITEKMYMSNRNPLENQLLSIQICYIIVAFFVLQYNNKNINRVYCDIQAYFYYSAWFTSQLYNLLLVFTIYKIIINQQQQVIEKIFRYKILAVAISLIIFFVPIPLDEYKQCGVVQFKYYCGLCKQQEDPIKILYWNWLLPNMFAILMGIFYFVKIFLRTRMEEQLSEQKKFCLKILTIPAVNYVFLGINMSLKFVMRQKLNGGLLYLYVLLNLLFYVVPIVNLIFFVGAMKFYQRNFKYFSFCIYGFRPRGEENTNNSSLLIYTSIDGSNSDKLKENDKIQN